MPFVKAQGTRVRLPPPPPFLLCKKASGSGRLTFGGPVRCASGLVAALGMTHAFANMVDKAMNKPTKLADARQGQNRIAR